MCWSFQVSFAVTIVELCVCLIMLKRRQGIDPAILPLCINVMLVELAETILWKHVLPLSELASSTSVQCPYVNRNTTFFLRLVILFQPIATAFYAMRGTELELKKYDTERTKELYQEYKGKRNLFLHILIFTLLFSGLMIYAAIKHEFDESLVLPQEQLFMQSLQTSTQTALGSKTCTFGPGPYGHLLWKFRVHILDQLYTPNYAYYLYVGFLIPALYARPWLKIASVMAISLALFVASAIMVPNAESNSIWCFSAIYIHLYALVYPYLFEKVKLS